MDESISLAKTRASVPDKERLVRLSVTGMPNGNKRIDENDTIKSPIRPLSKYRYEWGKKKRSEKYINNKKSRGFGYGGCKNKK